MKSLVTALGALTLSFALTVIAAAQVTGPSTANELAPNPAQTTAPGQPRLPPAQTGAPSVDPISHNRYPAQPAQPEPIDPDGERVAPQASTPRTSHLPLAEAKKRYLDTQKRLQDLVKDGSPRSLRVLDLEVSMQEPRDRIRSAVTEAFDARRQLQQAELADLEARVARIKRALEIRDAMRQTLIDQRTDELLDQMEEGGESDKTEEPAASVDDRPAASGSRDGAATEPADGDVGALTEQARTLKRYVTVAKANFESAERAHLRAVKLFQKGAISQEAMDDEQRKLKEAKYLLDRNVLDWEAFVEAHPDLAETNEPAADPGAPDGGAVAPPTAKEEAATPHAGDARTPRREARLLELDVKEATAILEAATKAYSRIRAQHHLGRTDQGTVDEHAEKYKRAQIQLERARLKLDAFRESHPDSPEANKPAAPLG